MLLLLRNAQAKCRVLETRMREGQGQLLDQLVALGFAEPITVPVAAFGQLIAPNGARAPFGLHYDLPTRVFSGQFRQESKSGVGMRACLWNDSEPAGGAEIRHAVDWAYFFRLPSFKAANHSAAGCLEDAELFVHGRIGGLKLRDPGSVGQAENGLSVAKSFGRRGAGSRHSEGLELLQQAKGTYETLLRNPD